MIYNPGCVAAHLASKKLFNIFWIQLSSIWSDNAIPRWKNNNYSEAGCTGAEFSLSFGELGRRRFRENCRDLKMHPVCNLQPCIIFWPQTLSPVKRYLLLWKLCQCLSQMECLLDFGTYVSVWPHRLNTFEPLWSLFQQRGVLRWDNLAFLGKIKRTCKVWKYI